MKKAEERATEEVPPQVSFEEARKDFLLSVKDLKHCTFEEFTKAFKQHIISDIVRYNPRNNKSRRWLRGLYHKLSIYRSRKQMRILIESTEYIHTSRVLIRYKSTIL
jgi:hypothetical protein